MLIALGYDHRGKRIARKLVFEVLFQNGPVMDDSSVNDLPQQLLQKDASEASFIGSVFVGGDDESTLLNRVNSSSCEGALVLYGEVTSDGKNFWGKKLISIEPPKYASPGHDNSDGTVGGALTQIDYPDIAASIAQKVSTGEVDLGILIGGTGIGMEITANKFRNVRAAVCYNEVAAELSRRHNDANILCLSGEMLGEAMLATIVKKWLVTKFEGNRHQRRLDKIHVIEERTGL